MFGRTLRRMRDTLRHNGGQLESDMPLLSYWCHKCESFVVLTLEDLSLL